MSFTTVDPGDYVQDDGRPQLYLFLSCNDGDGSTYSTAGVSGSLYGADLHAQWDDIVDEFLAACAANNIQGGLYFSWYAGQCNSTIASPQSVIGNAPTDIGNYVVFCTPITEYQGIQISGNNATYEQYRWDLTEFVASKAPDMVAPIFYTACVPANSDVMWDAHFPAALAVKAKLGLDASAVVDYTEDRCDVTAIDPVNYPGDYLWGSYTIHTDDVETGTGNPPLDGESIELVANNVDSGGNSLVQSVAANRPIFKATAGPNGLSCARFDGVNDFLETSNSGSFGDFKATVIFKDPSGVTGSERLVDHSYITGFYMARASSGANSWGGGVKETSAPYGTFGTCTDNQWHILTLQRSGTEKTVWIDGVSLTPNTVVDSLTGSNKINLGRAIDGSTPSNADIYHFHFQQNGLDDNLRMLVEKGFEVTTGITVSGSPTLPHRDAVIQMANNNVQVYLEGWPRRDLPTKIGIWGDTLAAQSCFGGIIGITNHHRSFYDPNNTATWGSADYNSAAGPGSAVYSNEYNLATDYANVNGMAVRPLVLIVGETMAARKAEMNRWALKGCSIAIEGAVGEMSDLVAQFAAMIAPSEGSNDRFSRAFMRDRGTSPRFMVP